LKMPVRVGHFLESANEAVEKELRAGEWQNYPAYDTQKSEGASEYVYAPLNEENTPISYQPLAEIPTLFLEFAGLANEDITREVWLDWIERYGVLGLEWDDLVRHAAQRHLELGSDLGGFLSEVDQLPRSKLGSVLQEGGPKESYQNFVEEARKANGLLRLYETVTDPEQEPDVELVKRHAEREGLGRWVRTPWTAKTWALGWVSHVVQERVAEDCYPSLYQDGDTVLYGWGFHTLLGAMYLQMMWLLIATGEVRCKARGCTRIITYEQPEQPLEELERKDYRKPNKVRSDKVFCSKRCYARWHYHNKRKVKE
jgi:hypothetical protein